MGYFSQTLYNKFDYLPYQKLSKHLELFELEDYHCIENYDIDTKITYNGITLQLELEVLQGWQNKEFPYSKIHHLQRKVNKYKDYMNAYYLQFNETCEYVAITNFKDTYNIMNLRKDFPCKYDGGYRYDDIYRNPLCHTTFIPIKDIEIYFISEMLFL